MKPRVLGLLLASLAALASACGGPDSAPSTKPDPYLVDASYRRATLVASLVNPDNGYSRLRLSSYESGGAGDWALLPEWNPRTQVVVAHELDAPAGARADTPFGPDARALAISEDARRGDEAALVALGEDAFFRYPLQLAPMAETAAASREAFARYGFWTDDARGAGGLVRVELPAGGRVLAYSCATCHATSRDGALAVGLGNERIELGQLAFDAATRAGQSPAAMERWLAWGPGRNDVTTLDGREPVKIADLRPARWLTHLHADASVAQKDRAALAVRIETLIITAHGARTRPPREVALGLAAYVWSLADTLPAERPRDALQTRGAAVFDATCARCHAPPALTGPPVALDVVGTDPAIGRSADRGTGMYRVPSLHGVSTRRALLHDASLPSLDAMFDPARLRPDFARGRHGAGAVTGHVFGLALDGDERAALLAYLATL